MPFTFTTAIVPDNVDSVKNWCKKHVCSFDYMWERRPQFAIKDRLAFRKEADHLKFKEFYKASLGSIRAVYIEE
jgi:hypothetical protein